MQTVLLFFVLPLFLAAATQAASFDCGKATTKVEKMICADAELSKLDEEITRKYSQAKKDLQNASWFAEQQRLWLQHRDTCQDRGCLESSYRQRLDGIGWYVAISKDPEETVRRKNQVYSYELEVNNDDKVCRHMGKVYNAYFRQPWAVHGSESTAYTPDGLYSFPKYPGVEGFNFSMFSIRYSRRPSSPEFDAVPWRVALHINKVPPYAPPLAVCEQYRQEKKMGPGGGGKDCFYPLLLANFDIDNDGQVETVVKNSFVTNYPPLDHHSRDHYYVFPQGTIDPWQFDYGPEYRSQYKKYGSWPRILSIEEFLVRPFIFNGVSYLSSYSRWWKEYDTDFPGDLCNHAAPDRNFMEIYKVRGGSELIPETKYAPAQYQMDLICRFNMKALNIQ